MKTYILDSVNRLKRYSQSLDVKTSFCNRSWWAFNDTGEKTLYVLKEDGTLYVTVNGQGIKGSWDHLAANDTIIFNYGDRVFMFHPEFKDDNILCLNLDGTESYAFLIDEAKKSEFAPQTLSQLAEYFDKKEQAIARQKQLEIEKALEEERRKEEERKRELERERKAEEKKRREAAEREAYLNSPEYKEMQLRKEAEQFKASGEYVPGGYKVAYAISLLLIIPFGFLVPFYLTDNVLIGVAIFFIMALTAGVSYEQLEKRLLKKWKAEHPSDPRCKYL